MQKPQNRRLKRENAILEEERGILKKNGVNLLKGTAGMKYEAIKACKNNFSVKRYVRC